MNVRHPHPRRQGLAARRHHLARDLIAPLIPGWEEDDSRRSFLGQIADSHNLEDTPMGVS